jgi:GxxExxY protein
LALEFERVNLKFEREKYSNLKYNEKVIAGFYLDFLINDKIILELKVANDFYIKNRQQVIQYLKNNNLKLGLVAIITPEKVLIKRIIN